MGPFFPTKFRIITHSVSICSGIIVALLAFALEYSNFAWLSFFITTFIVRTILIMCYNLKNKRKPFLGWFYF